MVTVVGRGVVVGGDRATGRRLVVVDTREFESEFKGFFDSLDI